MDRITAEVRTEHWKSIITKCHARPEGMTTKQWLAEHHISSKSYYYWQRKLRREAYSSMQNCKGTELQISGAAAPAVAFAEIPLAQIHTSSPQDSIQTPAAIIQTAGMQVAVSTAITPELLTVILREAAHA
ncbi:MAG: IS66 family insertion sequence element accessory protein TnpB [Lachnospiraceae bacterium]|nr:IS66 family insertion sequence element accessory protein TnpB [Lachnospiraceae bacterium]